METTHPTSKTNIHTAYDENSPLRLLRCNEGVYWRDNAHYESITERKETISQVAVPVIQFPRYDYMLSHNFWYSTSIYIRYFLLKSNIDTCRNSQILIDCGESWESQLTYMEFIALFPKKHDHSLIIYVKQAPCSAYQRLDVGSNTK